MTSLLAIRKSIEALVQVCKLESAFKTAMAGSRLVQTVRMTMKKTVFRPVCAALLLSGVLLGNGAQAAASLAVGVDPSATPAKPKKTGAHGQVKFLPGSSETVNERRSRLKRECRGQVNAGVCAGYTH